MFVSCKKTVKREENVFSNINDMIDASLQMSGGEGQISQQAAALEQGAGRVISYDSLLTGGYTEANQGLVDQTAGFLQASQTLLEAGVTPVDLQAAAQHQDTVPIPPILRAFRAMFGSSVRYTAEGGRQVVESPELNIHIPSLNHPLSEHAIQP